MTGERFKPLTPEDCFNLVNRHIETEMSEEEAEALQHFIEQDGLVEAYGQLISAIASEETLWDGKPLDRDTDIVKARPITVTLLLDEIELDKKRDSQPEEWAQ